MTLVAGRVSHLEELRREDSERMLWAKATSRLVTIEEQVSSLRSDHTKTAADQQVQ